jgi:hypothetical protein
MKGKNRNKKSNSTKILRKNIFPRTDDFENQGFHNEMTKRNIFDEIV